ncbi:DUF5987 family protein [Saccharomonospora halophila]|uniref:DUF5987 family protein n=1 Tax=Saccharomonospora halophila TaxID=129922 RepID=UPI00038056CA|nr:DUF5987 family protein [Saccharomonospora halophila]
MDSRTATLEAFADTIVPGEKRSAEDGSVAGVSTGGGAVAAGAIELLETPATGIADGLTDYATALNAHARQYATERKLSLESSTPPFVAMSFTHRAALLARLTAPDHPEKEMWVLLALFSNMAFDTAAHKHTAEALAEGHPGLRTLGFADPDPDGFWRFPDYSYRRPLARMHPDTTSSGSPA